MLFQWSACVKADPPPPPPLQERDIADLCMMSMVNILSISLSQLLSICVFIVLQNLGPANGSACIW